MKYIGPFLRINKIKPANVRYQLFYLAKESLNQIVLYSKCGVPTSVKELKIKNISNSDINTFKNLSPLLCVYRKANPNLINLDDKLCWNEDKFKKEINIDSNALMTLCLLELCDYYNSFKNIDTNKYNLSKLYASLCKKQLEFYALYFRNEEGVFIDKKQESSSYSEEVKFVDKNKKFKFSTQALLMAAYYKCSLLMEGDEKDNFKNFSFDILNMFLEFKEDLYQLSLEELTKLCFSLNIFYNYSKDEQCQSLIIDLSELLFSKFYNKQSMLDTGKAMDVENECLNYINYMLIYKYTGIVKSKENAESIHEKIMSLYNSEKGMFMKVLDEKNVDFSSLEIMLYLIVCLVDADTHEDKDNRNLIALDVFKRQVIDSGIILSWPEAPALNSVERYRSFSLKSEDLIEEQDFRMSSVPTPESSEMAPVFAKYVTYNRKKESFKPPKTSFDSYRNMLIFFITIHLLSPEVSIRGIDFINENK